MESYSGDTAILHNNALVQIESVSGETAKVRYVHSGKTAQVPLAQLEETSLPDDEDEYLSSINTRYSPLIRS